MSTTLHHPDPLLRITSVGLRIAGIVTLTLAGFMALCAPLVLVPFSSQSLASAHVLPSAMSLAEFRIVLGAVTLLASTFLALGWMVLRLLRQIVDTVADDPFTHDNVRRLRKMALNLVAMQLIGYGSVSLGRLLEGKALTFWTVFDLDVTGILAIVMLFILARVFQRGAEMRIELEGTV